LRKRINSLNQSIFSCGAVSGLFVSPPSNPVEAFTTAVVGHHSLFLFRDRAVSIMACFETGEACYLTYSKLRVILGASFLLDGVLKGSWLWWYGFFHFEVTCLMS